MCQENNIETTETNTDIDPGWLGKPKGMLQILWGRGYIDVMKVKNPRSMQCSKDGKKDVDCDGKGKLNNTGRQYCLSYILSACDDFKNEKTELAYVAGILSEFITGTSSILFTPKFHCELVVSYNSAKNKYRTQY